MPIALLGTRRFAWAWAVQWMRAVMFLWKWTTNSTYEFRGVENIPEGGFIIASKHQSTWETLGLALCIYDIVFVLKKELMHIPIFGWFAWKAKMIPIRRGERSKVLGPMIDAAREAVTAGRSIVIFMEGTRMAPGTTRTYKQGAVRMYDALDCPILPVAVNTGLFWPRNGFWRYSGHVIIEFLPPIMPGLSKRKAHEQLEREVEAASNALILETARSNNPPPTIHAALDALEARGVDVSSVR